MSPLSGSVVVVLLILYGLVVEAQNPVLTFTCSDMPGVCC